MEWDIRGFMGAPPSCPRSCPPKKTTNSRHPPPVRGTPDQGRCRLTRTSQRTRARSSSSRRLSHHVSHIRFFLLRLSFSCSVVHFCILPAILGPLGNSLPVNCRFSKTRTFPHCTHLPHLRLSVCGLFSRPPPNSKTSARMQQATCARATTSRRSAKPSRPDVVPAARPIRSMWRFTGSDARRPASKTASLAGEGMDACFIRRPPSGPFERFKYSLDQRASSSIRLAAVKARGMSAAITRRKSLGVRRVALLRPAMRPARRRPYAPMRGLSCLPSCPLRPRRRQPSSESAVGGAKVFLVNWLIRRLRQARPPRDGAFWRFVSPRSGAVSH